MVAGISRVSRFGPGRRLVLGLLLALVASFAPPRTQAAKKPKPPYTYYALGSPEIQPSIGQARPTPSYALMGGGPDVDEAFRWMIQRAGIAPGTGGRLVVIRATGDDAYNPYIFYSGKKSSTSTDWKDGWVGGASLGLTSVETLVIPSTQAADDPEVNRIVARANAVWIAGGDQSHYLRFWKGHMLERTLAALMTMNVPIGGTSAGLAVLGGFDFAALNGTVTSVQAMSNPYNPFMTIDPTDPDDVSGTTLSRSGGFIAPPVFANVIFDSHLDSRDRMGRLVSFVSRLVETTSGAGQSYGCTGGVLGSGVARGVGIGVETALLVAGREHGGKPGYSARRVTNISTTSESAVYFVSLIQSPTVCREGAPLSVPSSSVVIHKLADSDREIDFETLAGLPDVYRYTGVSAGVLDDPNPY
ncbi:MAG: cyanophycinase [Burkholderiaceae bacterium]|nr:cyanophycinase [Burkholderiaceae bacterium]